MAEGGEVDTAENQLVSIFGEVVVRGDTLEEIPVAELGGEGKVVGVYFSGHWCPPCSSSPLSSQSGTRGSRRDPMVTSWRLSL